MKTNHQPPKGLSCISRRGKREKNKGTCDVLRTRELPRNQQVLARTTVGWFENSADLSWEGGWVTPIQLTIRAAFQDKMHTLKNGIKLGPVMATERRLR